MMGENGEVKLTDFGFCARLGDGKQARTSTAGTPYWMSPEVIKE